MIQTTPFNPLKLGAAVKPVVNQKGDHLAPAVALSLSILNKTNHDFITMSLEEGRKTIDREGQLADFVSRQDIDIQDENAAGIQSVVTDIKKVTKGQLFSSMVVDGFLDRLCRMILHVLIWLNKQVRRSLV
ncbi:hypothetical protein [Streptococcus pluranimalium]|uniref:hypothetical protein n=1 Tax=Streptococcus pluranimalium TaxID=82348 RepID=UPI003F69218B